MNLLCPNCQKMIEVAEEYAGQEVKCPLCAAMVPVPALPREPAAVSATSAPAIYPAAPQPAVAPSGFESPPLQRFEEPAPSPDASEYPHRFFIWISPRVVVWIAPVTVFLIFILSFFPWLGMYPGGNRVYSQSAWGTAFGLHTRDPLWKKVAGQDVAPGVSTPMLFYVLILGFGALPAAVASVLSLVLPQTLPPGIARLARWRALILGAIVVLGLFLLSLQLLWGFSLEHGLDEIADADKEVVDMRSQAETDEEHQKVELKRQQILALYNVHTSRCFRFVLFLHVVAIAGAGLEFWLERRGSKPLPQIEFRC